VPTKQAPNSPIRQARPEVVGLVLVESRHRDFGAACEAEGLDGCNISAAVVASLPKVERAEIQAFAGISDEIRASGSFGNYPVRVLTATSHGFTFFWGVVLRACEA